MNLSLQLARRFRRGKSSNRYISFVSLSSTLGIGLGCFVLIILLSVMNGFERELRERLLAIIPHAELFSINQQGIVDWREYQQVLGEDPRIRKVEPYTKITGMIQQGSALKAVELTGIQINAAIPTRWQNEISDADWQLLREGPNQVLLGKGILNKLGLAPGDKISVVIPSVTEDLTFAAPKNLYLTVAGSIQVGGELDNLIGIMHLETASEQAGIKSGAQGLRFQFYDPFAAYSIIREVGYGFPQAVYMSDWTRTQGHLYDDIRLVRVVVYIALSLVIAVACFNIVSSLVMAVKEKQASIAILKTMGATDSQIRNTFVFQGLLNGFIGVFWGTLLAVITAPNLSLIVAKLEDLLGIKVLSGDIYFIDFLPSQLQANDVLLTVLVAIVLSVLATLYPAQKAAAIQPARALH
ncbi:lipoprotein-releasing system transmembrane subunit LolC [Alteromonas alba]|uniref:Lipoprotein-releasing system transmembrane subunit LolC n=1 Tax=Alteromonas alba TaxID=2079529 RepID=A0A2S9V6T2_9ALTE|nr:lipoprotein-releasing ABC transporter permease subunit [Alteromonas alba]MCP4864214.1 lipoprotein-releasing ABC transporter permease subunit [Alteromonas sp.]PRO72138.1 lipoprotein-releasing system transmembrane subunit LolC [Alteromonas alba]